MALTKMKVSFFLIVCFKVVPLIFFYVITLTDIRAVDGFDIYKNSGLSTPYIDLVI